MRSLLNLGTIVVFAATLFGNPAIVSAQQTDVLNKLNKKLTELYNARRYADAIPIAQQLLAIREKALGPEHPEAATSRRYLAVLYANQGRYADAEPLLQRALAIREKALDPDHIGESLTNLASLYDSQGRYADAEPLLQRSLAISEKALGRDHPNVAESLSYLADVYDSQGRYAEAEPLYQRSLFIRSKGKAAAERSAIADGSVRDMGHGLGDQRRVLRYQLVTLHLDVARHGAYAKHIALEFDAREAFDRIDIDQDCGRAQTHIERWHQALPAHQDPRPLAVFFQQGKRFGQRTWS
jgi:tetratricopeptide (TPR) repeat protein